MGRSSSGQANLVVLVIGAFSAGKTTILRQLAGKKRQTIPTLGISEEIISIEEFEVLGIASGCER